MAQAIPPALQQELQKFDVLRSQLETLQRIVQQLQQDLSETSVTLEELRKQPEGIVTYKSVGQLMFRVEKAQIEEDLDERHKTLEITLASSKKKLESVTEKLKALQEKIQVELGKHNLRLQ